MSSEEMVVSHTDNNSDAMQITIPRRDLGGFLAGLLGQPRSLRKRVRRTFDIDHAFLTHIDSLINQRVTGQQAASLVSFKASITFADNRTQIISSREAFVNFNDNSDFRSIGVSITWAYLVQFPSRSTPEKQEITINIKTGELPGLDPGRKPQIAIVKALAFVLDNDDSEIQILVDYTELTWGIELLRHIEDAIRQRFSRETESIRRVRLIAGVVVPFATFVAMGLVPSLLHNWLTYNATRRTQMAIVESMKQSTGFEEIVGKKLDFLMAYWNQPPAAGTIAYWVCMTAIFMFFAAAWLFILQRPISFLTLNQASTLYKKEWERRRLAMKTGIIATLATGVVTGVLSNKLTALLEAIFF